MVISQSAKIPGRDITQYAWFSLRRFQNTTQTCARICALHEIPAKKKKNAEKQAEQIRFLLIQAKEYFDAGKSVSLVTRPVLYYYATMCLATAEILFKQSGESSLDRARSDHGHHGLTFVNRHQKRCEDAVQIAAAGLVAKPAIREAAQRYGTFELWHRTAREGPLTCDIKNQATDHEMTIHGIIATGSDVRLGYLADDGISLLDSLRYIPGMAPVLNSMGMTSKLVRCHVSRTISLRPHTRVIIQPTEKNILDLFLSNMTFNANDIERVRYTDYGHGGSLTIYDDPSDQNLVAKYRFPQSICEEYPTTIFYPDHPCLNEFGFIYVALFIAGNYARYYPDFWMHDVEESTQLGMAVEALLSVAERRIGLLALSELSQTYYVPTP